MAGIEEVNDFNEDVCFLKSIFGETVSLSLINSVLESCGGNVHLAADAIMSITNETLTGPPEAVARENWKDTVELPEHLPPAEPTDSMYNLPSTTASPISQEVQALSVSFSEAFRNTGAVPKKTPDIKIPKISYTKNVKPDQVGSIINHHNQGSRILILMRGAAGSGKTHLAKHIIDYTVGASSQNYGRHIFSTDSYFMRGGNYLFNKNGLEEAHSLNQRRVFDATNKGISPIIVDNTNMELWEMEPYVRDGVRNGYIIEIVEPKTPWARNVNQLAKKNIHGVSREAIRRMLDRYEKKLTPEVLFKTLKLTYPPNKNPPIKRNIPAITSPKSPSSPQKITLNKIEYDKNHFDSVTSTSNLEIFHFKSPDSPVKSINDETNGSSKNESTLPSNDDEIPNTECEERLQKIIEEAQQKFEQFEKVEKEWENGESWDSTAENINIASQDQAIALEPKPPREAEKNTEILIEPGSICDDWTKISMFMPPWQNESSSNLTTTVEAVVPVETESVGTGFEIEDMNQDMYKTLKCTPRNINEGIAEKSLPKMPKVIMLDKSTSTHENDLLVENNVCKNKEHHFRQLRGMFRSVPRYVLRDIFESCNYDSNWAFDVIHGFYSDRQGNESNADSKNISDSEEESNGEPTEDCSCLAAYNILPNRALVAPVAPEPEESPQKSTATPFSQKKTKKENKLPSDSSLQLKRQIESNVMISDNHYSQHHLDLRRRREMFHDNYEKPSGSAPFNADIEYVAETGASDMDTADINNAVVSPQNYTQQNPYFSNDIRDVVGPSTSYYNFQFMDSADSDTESDSNKSDSVEKIVPINMGPEFLAKLDELFGREGFQYPEEIQPVVNLPMSILRQINAHWTTSIAFQMDESSKQSEKMIKQDEDFARQLAAKEEEMSRVGEEPDVPSLKEIMDMELAYSFYEKDIAEWRNNEPQDLAARLSREKLYNLFPDLSKDVLSELLMAHDYSFKCTIESLIISTGQADWLEDEKGVEKFVMHKETLRKEKFIESQNKTLDDAEWPYLGNPQKPVNLDTVNYYRDEAQKFLLFRNANFEKARQYFANNSPYAAAFYSEIAALHTRKYEQSSCLAAAYLMNSLYEMEHRRIINYFQAVHTVCLSGSYLHNVQLVHTQRPGGSYTTSRRFIHNIQAVHTQRSGGSYTTSRRFIHYVQYHLMNNPEEDVLDLHYLRVPEAMVNLDIFLDQIILKLRTKNLNYKETWIITGKGMHSKGGPRIKPAAKRRLKARQIRCKEANAGLLHAQLHPTNKMTNELEQLENP